MKRHQANIFWEKVKLSGLMWISQKICWCLLFPTPIPSKENLHDAHPHEDDVNEDKKDTRSQNMNWSWLVNIEHLRQIFSAPPSLLHPHTFLGEPSWWEARQGSRRGRRGGRRGGRPGRALGLEYCLEYLMKSRSKYYFRYVLTKDQNENIMKEGRKEEEEAKHWTS